MTIDTPVAELKLELKNIKLHDDMSRETLCFSAAIHIDSKKVGSVSNTGTGGCHEYNWQDPQARERFRAWSETQASPEIIEKMDWVINGRVLQYGDCKFLVQHVHNRTLFRLKSKTYTDTTHFDVLSRAYGSYTQRYLTKHFGDDVELVLKTTEDARKHVYGDQA